MTLQYVCIGLNVMLLYTEHIIWKPKSVASWFFQHHRYQIQNWKRLSSWVWIVKVLDYLLKIWVRLRLPHKSCLPVIRLLLLTNKLLPGHHEHLRPKMSFCKYVIKLWLHNICRSVCLSYTICTFYAWKLHYSKCSTYINEEIMCIVRSV